MGDRGNERARAEDLEAADLRIAIVAARFNGDISRRLLTGAMQWLGEHGAPEPLVVWVPGAMEIPLMALSLAESGQTDAVIALGCVINGETAHFQYVSSACAEGLMHVNLDTGVPCAFGVLTTFDRDQALARSGPRNNKGAEAAETAVEMANLLRGIQEGSGDSLIQIGELDQD